jgi:benzoylformate decarboxylase
LSRKPSKTTAASVTVKHAALDLLRAFGIKKVFRKANPR